MASAAKRQPVRHFIAECGIVAPLFDVVRVQVFLTATMLTRFLVSPYNCTPPLNVFPSTARFRAGTAGRHILALLRTKTPYRVTGRKLYSAIFACVNFGGACLATAGFRTINLLKVLFVKLLAALWTLDHSAIVTNKPLRLTGHKGFTAVFAGEFVPLSFAVIAALFAQSPVSSGGGWRSAFTTNVFAFGTTLLNVAPCCIWLIAYCANLVSVLRFSHVDLLKHIPVNLWRYCLGSIRKTNGDMWNYKRKSAFRIQLPKHLDFSTSGLFSQAERMKTAFPALDIRRIE